MVEDDVSGRVTGRVVHIQGKVAHRHGVPFLQPAVGLEGPRRDTVGASVILQPRNPEPVELLRPLDRHPEPLGQFLGAPAMIDVTVGKDDLLDRDSLALGCGLEPVDVPAGIDECAAHRVRTPQQGAILL
jgi:hypothetical protein